MQLSDVIDAANQRLPAMLVGAAASAGSFLLGRWWGRRKDGRDWRRKEFLDRIMVTLNIFADGKLKIRTVMESSIEAVFLNRIAIEKVQAAARRCTLDNPILPIPPADRWYLLNYVLNQVAERFALGPVRQDAGVPVTAVRYALFLTCELVGEERIRKVRAMMVKEEHLKAFPYPDAMPVLENPWHDVRVRTLRQAAELYAKEPDNFLILEVCV
jgi:hypothetical protein